MQKKDTTLILNISIERLMFNADIEMYMSLPKFLNKARRSLEAFWVEWARFFSLFLKVNDMNLC